MPMSKHCPLAVYNIGVSLFSSDILINGFI
jgi:hypothetical protein